MNNVKIEIFDRFEKKLTDEGFIIVTKDDSRPWGGFFVIDEAQAEKFANSYFDGIDFNSFSSGKLSPKILIVAPDHRLSWQYHQRRAEIWQVVEGMVGVVRSDNDTEGEVIKLGKKDQISLKQGERHRLVGLDNWAVIAEIWQHTDEEYPSDEDDIIRVQDDFGR